MAMAEPTKMCVVIFGKTGHGKSTFANSLFGLRGDNVLFNADAGVGRVTLEPQAYTARVGEVNLRVIDTPGLFDNEINTIHERWPDILAAIVLGQSKIDAVIITVAARELASGAECVDLIHECIGPFICVRVIICFTKYLTSGKTEEEIIIEFNEKLNGGALGCQFVFSDIEADEATQNRIRTDTVRHVAEIRSREGRPLMMEDFRDHTERYFERFIQSLKTEVSLDSLRNSTSINIELLEFFITAEYMETVIADHNNAREAAALYASSWRTRLFGLALLMSLGGTSTEVNSTEFLFEYSREAIARASSLQTHE